MGLDTVELVMAFEEEFALEIPDAAAENMVTVGEAVDWIVGELKRLGRPVSPEDVFARVRKRTVEQSNVDPSRVRRETRFIDDLGLD